MNERNYFESEMRHMSTMGAVPKHPHHDDKISRHAADLSEHANMLGFSIDNMDLAADPRQDFYRFAAGRWLDKTVIPEEDARVGGFIGLFHLVNEQLVALLQNAAAESENEPQGSLKQQVGDFYASAMDTDRLSALGVTPLQPYLNQIGAIGNLTDLMAVVAHLSKIAGTPILLTPAVMADMKQSDVNIMNLGPGLLSLPNQAYYLFEAFAPVRDAFVAHVSQMLQKIDLEPQAAADQGKTILEVETLLAGAMLPPVEKKNPENLYHKMPVAELKALAPLVDFDTYFSELGFSLEGELNVIEPAYIEKLNELFAERSLDDFKGYLRWRLVHGLSQYLSPDIAELDLDFFMKKLQGNTKLLPCEQRVASQLQHSFGHPVAQLYVQAYFSAETRQKVEEMVANIKAEFKSRLEEVNPWIDPPTRTFALDKLDRMDIHVGYPENWVDYSSVEVNRDDYLGNVARLHQFDLDRNIAKLGQPVVDEEFNFAGSTLPTDINAAYQPLANKIEITAAILQPPFFYPDLDMGVNYGAIGAVIGHEITHGFDSSGRRFDAQGNMVDWWTVNDTEEFGALTDKLVEQFNQYEVLPDVFVNGHLTVTENTADLGGVSLAFNALKRALAKLPPAEKIDGFSPEQRFFIAWAQMWMSKARPEIAQQLVNADPHAPSAFRSTGPLVNLDEFFDTFGIQPDDGMWREKEERVEIW